MFAHVWMQDLLHWSIGFIDWNVLLDQHGGPNHQDATGALCESAANPCGDAAMVIADLTSTPPTLHKQAAYWVSKSSECYIPRRVLLSGSPATLQYMAHVSRFVLPGSVRLRMDTSREGPNTTQAILAVAFRTAAPENSTAVVLMNAGDTSEDVVLRDARYGAVNATLPPHSIQTWLY